MGDFIKSAFGYLGSGSNATKPDNEFVGQFIEVGSQTLRVKRVIAEGGYAVVFEAQDTTNGKEFALKRLISHDEATSKGILQEISVLKSLCGHPNIVQFISAASVGKESGRHVGTEFLILTELCKGGQLVDHMRKRGSAFPLDVVLRIFFQTCRAVQHMHKQHPPIIHRDLKVENLLLSTNGYIKLCDFGSCTTERHTPNMNWSALQRSLVQEEFERNTTPMYRSPEILDLYQNYPINEAMDIWALGCVLFYLCYNTHPFEDSAKLAILNANYNLPSTQSEYLVFHNLIKQMLLIDPQQRPAINDIIGELQELGNVHGVKLDCPVFGETRSPAPSAVAPAETNRTPSRPPPPRPPVAASVHPEDQQPADNSSYHSSSSNTSSASTPRPVAGNPPSGPSSGSGSGMFGYLKGSAGSFLKNMKDASSKVLETVSASMARPDMDFSYITSRLAVMSFPAEGGLESMTHNRIEEVQAFLNIRHPRSYAVYNLTLRPYRQDRFEGRLSQRGFDPSQAPQLRDLFEIMLNMSGWMQQARSNVCVLHCMDGKAASATVTCAFLCFCGLFQLPMDAMRMFMHRRFEPAMQPSQIRYVNYVCSMSGPDHLVPHSLPVTLLNLDIAPIPLFNKMKNGCRPFVEIFRGSKKIYSTLQDYESMKGYEYEDGHITIPLNGVCVCGDILITVYHARASFTVKGKISPIKICQVQFHTGFLGKNETQLVFEKHELDHVDSPDHYPAKFHLRVDLVVGAEGGKGAAPSGPMPWDSISWQGIQRGILFSDEEEMNHVLEQYRRSGQRENSIGNRREPTDLYATPQHSQHVDPPTQPNQGRSFFDTVEWREPDEAEPVTEIYASVHATVDDHLTVPGGGQLVGNLLDFSMDEDDAQPNVVQHSNTPQVAPRKDDFTLLDFGLEEDTATVPTQPVDQQFAFFDPFGGEMSTSQAPVPEAVQAPTSMLKPTVSLPRNATSAHDLRVTLSAASLGSMAGGSAASSVKKPDDPFSDLGGLLGGSSLKPTSGNGNKTSVSRLTDMQQTVSPTNESAQNKPVLGSGYRYGGSFQNLSAMAGAPPKVTPEASPSHRPAAPNLAATGGGPAAATAGGNYSRTNFTTSATGGVRPKVSEGAFGEFLKDYNVGSGGASGGSAQPRTMKEMRREQLVKETDPDKLKVNEWVDGKERNIRALLCSLPTMLWDGVRWKGVNMAELVTVDQVKRQYKNAIRCIHQDKWMGTEYENISKLITVELNDAMTEFEEEKNAAANAQPPPPAAGRMF